MPISETSRYKVNPGSLPPDRTLREDQGWLRMDVRWAISEASHQAAATVVGRTILAPGIGAKHDIHRHPHAEEWEYCLHGLGIKHIGEESVYIRPGDLVFVPRNVHHGLENGSDTEPLITLWGYCGAGSLEKAGYVTREEDEAAAKREESGR